jgi:ABC-type branched-subunit amino acid transport system substrate-binding protein
MNRRVAIGAAALAALLTACSSNSGSSGGSSSAAAGTPIKIMVIYPQQSTAYELPAIGDAATAAVDDINAKGGVNGHQLQLIECNEGVDPNLAAKCGTEAAADNVSAVVGAFSTFSDNYYPALVNAHIANFGEEPTEKLDNTSPNSFPFEGGAPVEYADTGTLLGSLGCKRLGIIQIDSVALTQSEENLTAGLQSTGGQVVADVPAPFTMTNYTTAVAKVAAEKADCVAPVLAAEGMADALPAIHQQLPSAHMAWTTAQYPPSELSSQAAAVAGQYAVASAIPPSDTSDANVQQFNADMQKYEPSSPREEQGEDAWAAVIAFAQVAKGLSNYDPQTVLTALGKECSLDVPLFGTVDFCKPGPLAKAPRLFNTKAYYLKIQGSNYVLDQPAPVDAASVLATSPGL